MSLRPNAQHPNENGWKSTFLMLDEIKDSYQGVRLIWGEASDEKRVSKINWDWFFPSQHWFSEVCTQSCWKYLCFVWNWVSFIPTPKLEVWLKTLWGFWLRFFGTQGGHVTHGPHPSNKSVHLYANAQIGVCSWWMGPLAVTQEEKDQDRRSIS